MSNDEKILQILTNMQSQLEEHGQILTTMDNRLTSIEEGQTRIEKKLDIVYDQTADLTEFRTETNTNLEIIKSNVTNLAKDFSTIEFVTGKNMSDIAMLKAVK